MLEVLDERYKIVEEIGEGGMANVYKAEDSVLERMVAIKVLQPQFASDPKFVARFQQEARSAAGLTHPNIVSIYDVGENQGVHFIVMELVEGRSLKEIILSDGPFPPARAVNIATQVCSALAFAHLKKIVHRDIKPQNILVSGDDRVKLTDFGIAQALASGTTSQTGQVFGSVHYFSPEQAKGETVAESADVYSTGIVLYEMLTGKLPFDGESVVSVALKHIQEEPPTPRSLIDRIPPSLEAMVLKAMAKNPLDRYPSAREFDKALRNYVQLSDQQTSAFRPVRGTEVRLEPPEADKVETSKIQAEKAQPQPKKPVQAKKGRGFDWLLFILSIATFFFILGLLVVGAAVYRAYAGSVASPTSAPASQISKGADKVLVPGIEKLDAQVAKSSIEGQGLNFSVTSEEYSDEVAQGKVLSQNPQPGDVAYKGDTVFVTLSKGAETLKVPTVMQMKYVEAASKLKADGFDVDMKEDWNSKVDKGIVFKQDPDGGIVSKPGSKVIVYVSKGAEMAVVPDIVGMPEQKAKDAIVNAGLKNYPWVNYQGHDVLPDRVLKTVEIGSVLSSDPPAGKEVPFGTEISIAVRKD